VKALVFERSLPRLAAARVAWKAGPLSFTRDADEPELPGPGWQRVRPRLAGICGSDLATVSGRSSRWFEPIVSFPFVPGHEIVGDLDDGTRVVVEPVLACAARDIDPPCAACAEGATDRCERLAFGHVQPGLQTGFCADTGGGWSTALVAHETQLHRVPEHMSDEAAVMVEPAACAIHGALASGVTGETAVVIGVGTLGLCAIAALRAHALPGRLVAAGKHPEQRRLARALGADTVVEPGELRRAVRRATGSMALDTGLTGGADVVVDCVGSEATLSEALAVVRPGGTIVLIGMPGQVSVDLTPLWQRQVMLVGAYAYGTEPDLDGRRTFELAFDLVQEADLGRLVSARYPLERFREAIDHAAGAGRRGAVKVAFDLRDERERKRHG
jgi:threonine dehydrogenase-like Zn-dependent dehydrogenase